jgi:hypothetical protein
MGILRSLYGIRCRASKPTLVVPLGYGIDRKNRIPTAARDVLWEASRLAEFWKVPIAYASSVYFFSGSEVHENRLKRELLIDMKSRQPLIMVKRGVNNSVEEAEAISEEYRGPREVILVVCDWAHARSAKRIWEEVFPLSEIVVYSVDCEWNERNRAWLQQSRFRWNIACLLRHALLIVGGLERIRNIRQPIGK